MNDDDKVLISLAVDANKLEQILDDHKTGEIGMITARERINDLFEYNARNFQIKLNIEANRLLEDSIAITQAAYDQQHADFSDLIEAIRGSK